MKEWSQIVCNVFSSLIKHSRVLELLSLQSKAAQVLKEGVQTTVTHTDLRKILI